MLQVSVLVCLILVAFVVEEEWMTWILLSHSSFLLILLFSLLLLCSGSWPRLHHRRVSLSREEWRRVEMVVGSHKEQVLSLIKRVIICRMKDGEADTY